MGDMAEIAALVERLVQSNAAATAAADERQRDLMHQLVAARPGVEALRAEKVAKLGAVLRKSLKLKDYKEDEMPVKEWLKRWDHEVVSQMIMCGVDAPLSREEGVNIFKDRLDFTVVKRLDMAFANRVPAVTWNDVTWVQLSTIMKEEFGPKVSQVGQVLQQFGPLRFKKTPEMTVASFAHQWAEQLPECLCPTNAAENQQCVDLIKRTLFYYSLDDVYIQKELCDMDGDPSFKAYFDQAVLSEQKRLSFTQIGESGSKLDPGAAACLALLDTDYSGVGYGQYRGQAGRGSSSYGGGDSYAQKGQSGQQRQQQQQPGYSSNTSGQSGNFGGNYDGSRSPRQQYDRHRSGQARERGRGRTSTG